MLAAFGHIVQLLENHIGGNNTSLSEELSFLLVNYINRKAYKYEFINTLRKLYSILDLSPEFCELSEKFFSSQSEIIKGFIINNLVDTLKNSKEKDQISFDECFKKHFPMSYAGFSMLAGISNISIEQWTLSILCNYKGDYELEESLMGALIMHRATGNMEGWDLDILLENANMSEAFKYDVKYRLI